MKGFTEKVDPISIKFEGLTMELKSNKVKILDNVTGELPPGSMTAVMGPSGGGKTTFMNALCGRAP